MPAPCYNVFFLKGYRTSICVKKRVRSRFVYLFVCFEIYLRANIWSNLWDVGVITEYHNNHKCFLFFFTKDSNKYQVICIIYVDHTLDHPLSKNNFVEVFYIITSAISLMIFFFWFPFKTASGVFVFFPSCSVNFESLNIVIGFKFCNSLFLSLSQTWSTY